ncbi:MAG TPA: lactate utilization protein [Candidatus Sulfomarinibacteraceae bacterium]|nr:lactate utilization protein [Candidatus Sulfomarinibacteraceae bacterium]
MGSREAILDRLRRERREMDHPPAWRSQRAFEDLSQRFAESLEAAGGEVHRAANLEEALEQLEAILQQTGAQRVVVNGEPPLAQLDLAQRWPAYEWRRAGDAGDDLRAFCAGADVGVSGADVALAETGTLVLSSGPQQSRMVTLLPPLHLALLPASRLTTDLFTWVAQRQRDEPGGMPANVTLISGPSKTADIEQTLAVGVHGPKRLIVFLYGDG